MTAYTGNTTLNGVTISAGTSPDPARAPKGLIVTRAVQVKAGWVGQIVVAEDIIWESEVFTDGESDDEIVEIDNGDPPSEKAEQAATERVITAIKGLFS